MDREVLLDQLRLALRAPDTPLQQLSSLLLCDPATVAAVFHHRSPVSTLLEYIWFSDGESSNKEKRSEDEVANDLRNQAGAVDNKVVADQQDIGTLEAAACTSGGPTVQFALCNVIAALNRARDQFTARAMAISDGVGLNLDEVGAMGTAGLRHYQFLQRQQWLAHRQEQRDSAAERHRYASLAEAEGLGSSNAPAV